MHFLLDAWGNDVRQALRRLARAPGLSAVVIATLGLAIAANTTIYSLLKPTVLRKLAAPDPDGLVAIGGLDARTNTYVSINLETLRALQSSQSFSRLGAFSSSIVRVESDGLAFDTGVEGVTAEYFDVLGLQPVAGRLIGASDDAFGAIGVITERLSGRLFGNQGAVGRRVIVDGRPVEIVGVVGGSFTGARMDGGDDLFLPLAFLRNVLLGTDPKGVTRAQNLVGRLAPSASLATARAEVQGRWPAIREVVAASVPPGLRPLVENQRLTVESFAGGFSLTRERYAQSLWLLMGLAASLLAVGCVNLSALMMARALTRRHEFAIQIALGVGRLRLAQQALIEGVLLSAAAFVVAMPLCWWASAVLASMVSVGKAVPIGKTTPDLSIVLLAAAISAGAGLLIGLLPMRQALTGTMDDVLRGRGPSHRIRGLTRVVLITQIAASMILVVGAGLFGRTLTHLYANDVTKREQEVIFSRPSRTALERGQPLPATYFPDLQQRLQAVPGGDRAAFSIMFPGWLSATTARLPYETVTMAGGTQVSAVTDTVSPSLFEVYAIPLLRGREFTWADGSARAEVAIVNEFLARKLVGSLDAVGQRVRVTSGPRTIDAEIVGVVAGTSVTSIRDREVPALYWPMPPGLSLATEAPMVHLRVNGDVATASRGYVDALNERGRHFVRALFTMSMWVDNAVVEQRLIAGMASAAATLAMMLACVGLFGVLAFSVSSRVREIGVRMSIGASAREIAAMVVREGLVVVVPGILIGIPLAIAAAWVVRAQLYGVSATDPVVIVVTGTAFLVVAAFASWLPARRAARIQPNDALRQG
ncbi:MAG TPA: ABC transporter permease [Vicinamibacterales bacterium]|nr:ABC transporter permease [Vicinamibacterales bacterium]